MTHLESTITTVGAIVVILGPPIGYVARKVRRIYGRIEILWNMHFQPTHPSLEHDHVRVLPRSRERKESRNA